MKFFNIDCHISIIADVTKIFTDLGHEVDSWSLSGHKWVFGLPDSPSKVITDRNWQSINQEMVDRFYDVHKDELDKYDAFICGYPPCFLKLFEKFNKPIIVIAATRYDHPFLNDPERLAWLEDSLNNNLNLILVANNEFDKAYCEHFLKREWEWIPSLCEYTNAKAIRTKGQSVLFSKFGVNGLGDDVIHQSSLGSYTWEDLYSYSSIIHLPYNISTMSIFEQFEAGMSLKFPSLDFSLELLAQGAPLFSEIVFPNSLPDRQPQKFLTKEWLSKADFYNGVVKCEYSETLEDLFGPIKNNYYHSNKNWVYYLWKKTLSRL